MNLRETTDVLLDSEDIATWLTLADAYIQQYNERPKLFVLPADHEMLAPIIAAFAKDPKRFVAYLKAVRDTLPKGDRAQDVNDLYRTVMTRYVQQERRDRLYRAIDKAESLYGVLSPVERAEYQRKLEKAWGARRMRAMAAERAGVSGKRLTTDERAKVLLDFWNEVEDEINRGDLPPVERR